MKAPAALLTALLGVTLLAGQSDPSDLAAEAARGVYSRALDAMGGRDRIAALKTLVIQAHVLHTDFANGTDTYEEEDYFRFPDASRSEIRVSGATHAIRQVMLNTPAGLWTADGTSEPEWHAPPGPPYDPFMMRAFLDRFDSPSDPPSVLDGSGPDIILRDSGSRGAASVELHFSRSTNLLTQRSAIAVGPTAEDVEAIYGDYRRVGKFTVPFTIKTQYNGGTDIYTEEFTVRSVRFDAALAQSLFESSSLKSVSARQGVRSLSP